jgi:hypothetical protein
MPSFAGFLPVVMTTRFTQLHRSGLDEMSNRDRPQIHGKNLEASAGHIQTAFVHQPRIQVKRFPWLFDDSAARLGSTFATLFRESEVVQLLCAEDVFSGVIQGDVPTRRAS